MRPLRPLCHLTYCLCLICSCPIGVAAQAAAQAQTATPSGYDALIEQGIQAYDAGRFAEARSLFRRAHELMPTARTLRTIGMCSFNLGDYADAVFDLERALRESRKPLNDEQRKSVSDLIARSNPHIGRFRLLLTPASAALTVDSHAALLVGQPSPAVGQPSPADGAPQDELLLDPGRHEIDAQAAGYRGAQSVLNVEGGDRTTVELRLTPASNAVALKRGLGTSEVIGDEAPAPHLTASEFRSDEQPSASSLPRTLGYVSLGVGALGVAGFGVTGALALVEKGKLETRCPNSTCTAPYFGRLDRYDALKTAATVSLIAGAGLAALGAGLLLLDREHPREQAALEPIIAPTAVGVRGTL